MKQFYFHIVMAVLLAVAATGGAGCQTTRTEPDGTTEIRTVNLEATIALTELALATVEQGIAVFIALDSAQYQREIAEQQARAEYLREMLYELRGILATATEPTEGE